MCPFYRWLYRNREHKCWGYREGFIDARMAEVARKILDTLSQYQITEEGMRMFKAMGCWATSVDRDFGIREFGEAVQRRMKWVFLF